MAELRHTNKSNLLPNVRRLSASSRPAATVSAARNRLTSVASSVSRQIDEFVRKILADADDDLSDVYDNFIRHLIRKGDVKEELNCWQDVNVEIIEKFNSDTDISNRNDFRRLVTVCTVAAAFDALIVVVRSKLEDAYRTADTCLASFYQEAKCYRFRCVETYENQLSRSRGIIVNGIEQTIDFVSEIENMRPLAKYLSEYGKVLHYMQEACRFARASARALQRWVADDEAFLCNVGKELRLLQKQRSSENRSSLSASISFDVWHGSSRMRGVVHAAKLDMQSNERRLSELRDSKSVTDDKLQTALQQLRQKEKVLASTEKDIHRQRLNSSSLKTIAEQLRQIEGEIADLHSVIIKLRSYRHLVQEDLHCVSHSLRYQKRELTRREKVANAFQAKRVVRLASIKNSSRESSVTEDMIDALKKIQTLKNCSQSLRQMDSITQAVDYKVAMEEAIVRSARLVCDSWPQLYASLTFYPQRPKEYILEDIEGIRRTGERFGHSSEQMALLALSRWAKKSGEASIKELTFLTKQVVAQKRGGKFADSIAHNLRPLTWIEGAVPSSLHTGSISLG